MYNFLIDVMLKSFLVCDLFSLANNNNNMCLFRWSVNRHIHKEWRHFLGAIKHKSITS